MLAPERRTRTIDERRNPAELRRKPRTKHGDALRGCKILERPVINDQRGRNAERDHVGETVELGAKRADVLRLVVRQGMIMASIGLAIGLIGAFSLSRVMRSMLHGVSPTDPLTFTGVSIVLLGVALLACLIPARRATRVDPIVALRNE